MNRLSTSVNNSEQVLQLQITDLQSNIAVMGTNLAVGPGALEQLTTGTNNIAIGLGAASGQYGLATGNGNVMLGVNSGPSCVTGSNNTGMWTCPTAGLWQFTFSIFCQNYSGYPGWNLYQNGTIVTLIEQASNGTQWLTSVGPFITPAKAGNTFQWKLQFVDDSSPPAVVNGPGNF